MKSHECVLTQNPWSHSLFPLGNCQVSCWINLNSYNRDQYFMPPLNVVQNELFSSGSQYKKAEAVPPGCSRSVSDVKGFGLFWLCEHIGVGSVVLSI